MRYESREAYMEALNDLIGDRSDDAALTAMENFADTYDELATADQSARIAELEAENTNLRNRYKERFSAKPEPDPEPDVPGIPENRTYDSLFN